MPLSFPSLPEPQQCLESVFPLWLLPLPLRTLATESKEPWPFPELPKWMVLSSYRNQGFHQECDLDALCMMGELKGTLGDEQEACCAVVWALLATRQEYYYQWSLLQTVVFQCFFRAIDCHMAAFSSPRSVTLQGLSYFCF